MDPQQELFTELRTKIKALGYDVYDGGLPPKGTAYPFVYLGDMQQTDMGNKSAIFGTCYPTIHIYHDRSDKRGTVSKMALGIKDVIRHLTRTKSFGWMVRSMEQKYLIDRDSDISLTHAVIQPEFLFS